MIEILVYCFLSILALVVVWALYMLARRTQTSSYSSYMVGGNTESAITALRRDFSQTPLASIVSWPPGGAPGPIGASMASAMTDVLQINPYGAPNWDRTVYYALLAAKPGDQTGTLYRYVEEWPKKTFMPLISPTPPGDKPGKRPVLHNVLMSGALIENVSGQPGGKYQADAFGGFRVQFVRREGGPGGTESVVSQNPGTDKKHDHTGLVEIELKILQKSGFGKPDLYTNKFRVRPAF